MLLRITYAVPVPRGVNPQRTKNALLLLAVVLDQPDQIFAVDSASTEESDRKDMGNCVSKQFHSIWT